MKVPIHRFHTEGDPLQMWIDVHNTWPALENWHDGFDLVVHDGSYIDAKYVSVQYLSGGVKYTFTAGPYTIIIWE